MKTIVLWAVLIAGCEHDPRYDRHVDQRPVPPPTVVVAPPDAAPVAFPVEERTIERPVTPKIVPFEQRTHHHHRH
jgi:hypothetical protein